MISRETGKMKPGRERTTRPSMKDIYWAAGIYEGEGHCRNSSGPRSGTSSIVSVIQKDDWILKRLKCLFGGKCYSNEGRACLTWKIYGARARGFLMTIYELLSPRRKKQAINVLLRERRK